MVRTSGITDKLRSNALKELAKERGIKRKSDIKSSKACDRLDSDQGEEAAINDEEIDRIEQDRRAKRAKHSNNNLLSILPKPKNSSAFGPTVRLDKLLKMPERSDDHIGTSDEQTGSETSKLSKDGMIEVDISKVIGDASPNVIKDLTIEKSQPVALPKGKEKQKNQITYLAQLSKANELERKEQAAQSRINKAAARSKYGW